jgi:hypothetical protein
MTKKPINSDLIADLTWAELYTAKIRETLKILTPAVKKISTRAEPLESAALLRQQLASANRTAAELRKMIGLEPRRTNRRRSDDPSIH